MQTYGKWEWNGLHLKWQYHTPRCPNAMLYVASTKTGNLLAHSTSSDGQRHDRDQVAETGRTTSLGGNASDGNVVGGLKGANGFIWLRTNDNLNSILVCSFTCFMTASTVKYSWIYNVCISLFCVYSLVSGVARVLEQRTNPMLKWIIYSCLSTIAVKMLLSQNGKGSRTLPKPLPTPLLLVRLLVILSASLHFQVSTDRPAPNSMTNSAVLSASSSEHRAVTVGMSHRLTDIWIR